MENNTVYTEIDGAKYKKSVSTLGIICNYGALFLFLAVPVAMSIHFKEYPTFMEIFEPLMTILPLFFIVQIIESITYIPMLGQNASYLCFVTGNLSNLKVPAVMNALDITKTDGNSIDGEIYSTIAVAISSLVTTLILAVGVFIFILIPSFQDFLVSPSLAPAFDNLLAALFGAMGFVFVVKNPKISIAPICFSLILFFGLGTETYNSIVSVLVPVVAVVAIVVARILYKKGKI